jgi:hypothetical protein
MLELREADYAYVSRYFWDFQKKSHCFELPSDESDLLGIYDGEELVGYFVTTCYDNGVVVINQGYLKPTARHKDLPKEAMRLLEEKILEAGYKKVELVTKRAARSYTKFMNGLGYKVKQTEFEKVLGA